MKSYRRSGGFSLIELLVVIAIISVLAVVSAVSFGQFGGSSRDAERQSDLRAMQVAIENYRQQNGRYPAMGPAACISGGWSRSSACPQTFIVGLTEYINPLPSDPRPGSGTGYVYRTNTEGTVYKLAARGTVEDGPVTSTHPFSACAASCPASGTCAPTHSLYQTSYAVWGGFADGANDAAVITNTNTVICPL